MKTIALTLTALSIAFGSVAGNGGEEKTTAKVNTEKSTVFWTGKKVTGEHTGTLGLKSGEVVIENGAPVSATMILDMSKIVCTDIKDDGTNQQFLGHLNSPDFFSVEAHPQGEFKATSFTPIAGTKDREPNYTVKGTLTLKGVSHPIEFPAFVSVKGKTVVANGKLTFDRTKYDIKYGSGNFFDGLGDKVIYDDVALNFVLSAN